MNFKTLTKTFIFIITLCFSLSSHADIKWIDVRSIDEHRIDNIAGDIRISHYNIVEELTHLYPDLNTEIRLYCRSGNRSGQAMSALKIAGYTNVSNSGGIAQTRDERDLN
jgi:phage shock protein E